MHAVLQAAFCALLSSCILTPSSAISTFDCSFDGSTAFAVRHAGEFEIAGLFPNATWQRHLRLEVEAGLVNACGVNPQDSILYCLITDGDSVFIKRLADGQSEFVARLPNGTTVRTVAFRLDGTLFLAGDTAISSLEDVASIPGSASPPSSETWSALRAVAHGIEPAAVGGIVSYVGNLDGSGEAAYVASLVPSGLLLWREGSGFQSFAVQGAPSGTYDVAWHFGLRVFFASSTGADIVEVFMGSLDFAAMTVRAQRILVMPVLGDIRGGVNCVSSRPSFPYSCSDVPAPNQLPAMAIQDCGQDNLNGSSCPFNCTNAWSHTGQLMCVNGVWVTDASDPPQCIAPCQNIPGILDVRTRSVLIDYEFGYWASPTVPTTTTTTTLPCDLPQAETCLQSVISITDIQEFCAAMPTSIRCLKNANCCSAAGTPITGSINSCLDAGVQLENECEEKTELGATCDADDATTSCLTNLPKTISSNQSCFDLQRAPLCVFSKSCCPLLPDIGPQTTACASIGFHVRNPCVEEELPIANEGAVIRESCRSPRVAANYSVLEEDYVCKDGSFSLLGSSNLTCLELPCRLSPHPDGSYDCVLAGRPLQLEEDSEGYVVPLGAACSLRCHANYQQPLPLVEYRCAYAESDYPDIIYLSETVSSSAVPQMVQRGLSGALEPLATSQVCLDVNCTPPTLDDTVATILSIECEGVSFNSTCSPVCVPGYAPDSRQMLRCYADGSFHGFLSCLPLPCDPTLPEQKVVSGSSRFSGAGLLPIGFIPSPAVSTCVCCFKPFWASFPTSGSDEPPRPLGEIPAGSSASEHCKTTPREFDKAEVHVQNPGTPSLRQSAGSGFWRRFHLI